MDIRIILCVPSKSAQSIYIDGKVETIMKLLAGEPTDREPSQGWFSVIGLENKLLLYCLEHPVDEPFNRMIKNRPIFGNFLISRYDQNGVRKSLSDENYNYVINNLLTYTSNTTN